MIVADNIIEVREALAKMREVQKIILVPTMGNLHDGHLRLVKLAKTYAPFVVVSIFVNPLQFGPKEDFANYPRTLTQDIEKLSALDVDLVFTPPTSQMYPALEDQTHVYVPTLSEDLCGIFRPHFFRGVATVVTKLFNIIQPNFAAFGEKDFQQLLIVRKLVQDLCLPIEIVSVPTVREHDGLAMSSRNHYLNAKERQRAVILYQTLMQARQEIQDGNQNYQHLIKCAENSLTSAKFTVDYVSIRRRENLNEPNIHDRELIILAAAWLGNTRLIDNVHIDLNS